MMVESWAGVLSPGQFRALVIQPTRAIVAAIRRRYPAILVIEFPRLDRVLIGKYLGETGVQAAGIDAGTDLPTVRGMVPPPLALQGILDPLAVVARAAAMRVGIASLVDSVRGWSFIFNLGRGIAPQTPPFHVTELLEHVRVE